MFSLALKVSISFHIVKKNVQGGDQNATEQIEKDAAPVSIIHK